MSSSALLVHVPVDALDIVKGPGSKAMLDAYARLQNVKPSEEFYVTLPFTFKSPASNQPFKRLVKIAAILIEDDVQGMKPICNLFFTGIFCNKYVEGSYNIATQKGDLYPG